ncbi:MAG: rRNA pseudouridine synthase [Leptolyngbyaceae cyanobacterium SM2_5_2]|nr:rRNA pseudouridine synthase [Leptolyngbyaceae cyanobacterium SM2_5_2]
MPERLQKVLAQHGLASRRQAEAWIQSGRVTVNGAAAYLGQKVDLTTDRIAVDNRPMQPAQSPQYHYLLLHKPLGVVSTCADPEGRPTVLDALPEQLQSLGLHPVGRLDAYSTGALLLTNDGDLTYRLTHPKHDVAKTYQVQLEGVVSEQDLAAWRQGVELDGRLTRPAHVRRIAPPTDGTTRLEIKLLEGRNRQIRRVAQTLGYRVLRLHRTAVGSIQLGALRSGAYRTLSSAEIEALLAESDVQPTVLKQPSSPVVGTLPF